MLSMSKDYLGKIVLDITGCDEIKEVTILRMKDLGLKEFDQQMFNQLRNLVEIDVSGNELTSIPSYISFPLLRRLDCSRNNITDLTFISQFPNIEELVVAGNPVVFSDLCIANTLCPSLRLIDDQEFNIETLRKQTKGKMLPVISKVWEELFAPSYSPSMSEAAFQALDRKFRVVLSYKRLATAKLNAKFCDFMMSNLTDEFLKNVRTASSKEASSLHCRNYSKRISRITAAFSKDTISDPVIWPVDSTPPQTSLPAISDITRSVDSALQESEVWLDAGEFVIDDGNIVMDDAQLLETPVAAGDVSTVSDSDHGQLIETPDSVVSTVSSVPESDQATADVSGDLPFNDISSFDSEECVKEIVVETSASDNSSADASQIHRNPITDHSDLASPSLSNKSVTVTDTVVGEPKPVKFWLYDTDAEKRSFKMMAAKPVRAVVSTRPPRSGQGRGKVGRRKNPNKYLVGPPPLYGWKLVAAMAKGENDVTTQSEGMPQTTETPTTSVEITTGLRAESPSAIDVAPGAKRVPSIVASPAFKGVTVALGSQTNSSKVADPERDSSILKEGTPKEVNYEPAPDVNTTDIRNSETVKKNASMKEVLLSSKLTSTQRKVTPPAAKNDAKNVKAVAKSATSSSENRSTVDGCALSTTDIAVTTAIESQDLNSPAASQEAVIACDESGASQDVAFQTGRLSTLAAVACTCLLQSATDSSTVDVAAGSPSLIDGCDEPPTKKKRVRFLDQVKASS